MELINIFPQNWKYKILGKIRAKKFCKFFLLWDKYKNKLSDVLLEIGNFETYIRSVEILNNSDLKGKFCIPEIINNNTEKKLPIIKATEIWNPFIPVSDAVTNDIDFDGVNLSIKFLYGMNASGKTTLLESIGYVVWLGYALGICPAKECSFTSFKKILT